MYLRRLFSTVGVGLLGGMTLLVGTPAAASAALPAPTGFTVARAAESVYQVKVGWKPVTGVDHYVLDVTADDIQTVIDVPATATSYTIDAPNPCTGYKVI